MSRRSLPNVRRTLGLFVVRESDESDDVLFDAMRNQTYIRFRTTRAVEEVRAVGMAPLKSGDSFLIKTVVDGEVREIPVPVRVLREGGTTATLFFWRGYAHLWSQSSAAKAGRGSRATNEFTSILMRVIEEQRPTAVLAANFSRLIRSQYQGNHLMTSLQGRVDLILAGDTSFPLTGPRAAEGQMMFQMFAMVASMERNWIVQRLLTGRIAQWRRGEWTLGGWSVPFGYEYDKKTQKLSVDPAKRESVRSALIILAGDAPPAEKVRQLARVGYKIRKRGKGNAGWAVVDATATSSPHDFIDALYCWASVYCHGEFLLRLTNVFPGVTDIAGVPVTMRDGADDDDSNDLDALVTDDLDRTLQAHQLTEPSADADSGELQLLYKVGVPEGGWAEPEVLDAFAEKAMARMATSRAYREVGPRPLNPAVVEGSANPELLGAVVSEHLMRRDPSYRDRLQNARSKSRVAPFAGRGWADGGWWYELRATAKLMYTLVRFPLAMKVTAAAVARELDREMAYSDAFADLAGDGFDSEFLAGYGIDPLDLEDVV